MHIAAQEGKRPLAAKRTQSGARPPPPVQPGPELWLTAADVRSADAGATAAATSWGRTLSAPARCGAWGGKEGAGEPLSLPQAPGALL